jgi:hypothetical protein
MRNTENELKLVQHLEMGLILKRIPYIQGGMVSVKNSTLFLIACDEHQSSVYKKSVFGCPMI